MHFFPPGQYYQRIITYEVQILYFFKPYVAYLTWHTYLWVSLKWQHNCELIHDKGIDGGCKGFNFNELLYHQPIGTKRSLTLLNGNFWKMTEPLEHYKITFVAFILQDFLK